MSLEPTRFAETFVAIFASNLSSDTVSSKVISQGITVGITLVADVALCLLTLVGVFVDSGS